MQAGGRAGGVEYGKKRKAAALGGEEEVVEEATMSAGASRATTVDALRVGASTIGPGVEELANVPEGDSATVEADGDAGASTLAGVAAGAAVIGTAGQASGDVSLVKPDMQKENMEVGEGSKKRKLEEVAPDQEVVEPVEPPFENVVEPVEPPFENVVEPVEPPYADVVESDSSLEYDSQDSAESVDSRNIESFKRNVLEKLEDRRLRFKKRGRFCCPWHMVKPKDGMLVSLKQHARELSVTGTSKKIRAEHVVLLQILAGEADA